MRPEVHITEEDVKNLDACYSQLELFRETFPEGADLTYDNLILAANAGLDIYRLACRLLDWPKDLTFPIAASTFVHQGGMRECPACSEGRRLSTKTLWEYIDRPGVTLHFGRRKVVTE